MSKVAVVTDSTAYLPQELITGNPISVIPLNVIWGENTYLDNVDIHPQEFYERLRTNKVNPTTSQPSPEAFRKVYEDLLEQGFDVISMHISAKLSGTVDSAMQARNELDPERIEVIDSQLTSMALGFPVHAVARAAVEGASLSECKALGENGCQNAGAIFTVSTLEYLHRGGRIGGAAAFLGTALDLKPILTLVDGKIEALERVRTLHKALDKLVVHLKEQTGRKTPLQIAIIHADCVPLGNKLMERVREAYGTSEIDIAVISEISPVIGTHTGPGTVGIAYMAGI